jgi:hypothetical protein
MTAFAPRVGLERAADAAANTGSIVNAAIAAARVAQLNNVAGGATMTWNASTKTPSGGALTVQVQNGGENSSDPAVTVSMGQRPDVPVQRHVE